MVLGLCLSDTAQERIRELLRRNSAGTLETGERAALENYLLVGQFLDLPASQGPRQFASAEYVMNEAIQFHSRVGDDGILNVQINLGCTAAKKEVVVTIQPASASEDVQQSAVRAWPDFVERTYASCAGLGLERHGQGDFELREPIA